MEYTKDIILNVNYGQVGKDKNRFIQFFKGKILKHKIITVVISMTIMLITIDFILISSFINLLSHI